MISQLLHIIHICRLLRHVIFSEENAVCQWLIMIEDFLLFLMNSLLTVLGYSKGIAALCNTLLVERNILTCISGHADQCWNVASESIFKRGLGGVGMVVLNHIQLCIAFPEHILCVFIHKWHGVGSILINVFFTFGPRGRRARSARQIKSNHCVRSLIAGRPFGPVLGFYSCWCLGGCGVGFFDFWLLVCFWWWLGLVWVVWLLGWLGGGCLLFMVVFPVVFFCVGGGGVLIVFRITSISAAVFLSFSGSSVKMSSVGTWCLVCLVFSHFARTCSCVSSSFPHNLHWRSWYLFL